MNEPTTRPLDGRVPRARELRQNMTQAERKLWRGLRQAPPPGTHFRRQATIGPYFCDFACHTTRVVIEVDGGGHASPAQMLRDAQRTDYLKAQGYRVFRFWNNEVLGNLAGVISVIHAEVAAKELPPTPNPSPPLASLAGGGERAAASGEDVRP